MKALIASILFALSMSNANAAMAFLVSCTTGTSVTGRFVYIGTYSYGNQRFERVFTSWCPSSIEVY